MVDIKMLLFFSVVLLLHFGYLPYRIYCNQIDTVINHTNLTNNCRNNDTCEEINTNLTTANYDFISKSFQSSHTFTLDNTEEIFNQDCPDNVLCESLPAECLSCRFNYSCTYGQTLNVTCRAISTCTGEKVFERDMVCQYCYQTLAEEHSCSSIGHCNSPANPIQKYRSDCTVHSHILCLGQRKFFKNQRCNWTSGYRWSTTLILSITLGGFGADRFYLGHWQEGIGKLFSFGGAGVWTIVDVILVAVGYLKPADGSVYI